MGHGPNRATAITAIFVASALCALLAQATGVRKSPGTDAEPGAVLVELFTSEGCADYPPADALLRQIEGKQTESGQLIVGISEHVTYWNQLGWSDPFSSDTYTERQTAYGQRIHLDSVYTPQMVINGEEQTALFRALDQMDLTALEIPQSLLRQLFELDADYALDQPPRRFKLTPSCGILRQS
jgi:hypothetical protein